VRRLRGPLIVAGVGAAGAVAVGVADASVHAAVETAALLAGVGLGALACGQLLARRRGTVASLRRLLLLATVLAIAQLLIAAAAFAGLMFVSPHDALLLSLVAVYGGVVGAAATRPVAEGVIGDIADVRDGLEAVASGQRDLRLSDGRRDEIGELARSAEAMAIELGTQEQARRRLVGMVSHDLRTPITALRLLGDALREDVIPLGERDATLDRMAVHLRALSRLIDDLFELSRLESGELSWSLGRVQLRELLDEAIDAMRPEATAKGVAVHARLADGLQPVEGDPEGLQRVLFNLIQNAIRHTPADGSVTVLAEPVDGQLVVEVADTGVGIAGDQLERVFEPFERGERTADEAGAGLGLAISRAIVEAHGGRIWIEPAAVGTRVRFSLLLR